MERAANLDELSGLSAPELDFVFTVCDNAANEVCPIWPGQPMTAHWGVPNPAAVEALRKRLIEPSRPLSPSSIGESASSSAFRLRLSIRWHCNATLMTSAASNC